MKCIVILMFPIYLYGQAYQLDSIRRISPNQTSLDVYIYENDQDFYVYQFASYSNNSLDYHAVTYYQDSLKVREDFFQSGDSSTHIYEYDDHRRLTLESSFRHDSLQTITRRVYHNTTNLLELRESIYFRYGDTSLYYLEITDYDSELRVTSISTIQERNKEFYRASISKTNYIGDTLAYGFNLFSDSLGIWDTTYTMAIRLPDHTFGDTLRQWTKFYGVTKDTVVIYSDERVSYTWGNFYAYEDAGDWTYLHGILYGSHIDYEPAEDGFSFIAYESPWPHASPDNWKIDIINYARKIHEGTLKVNEIGLPIERRTQHNNGVVQRTNWYYSILNETAELSKATHREEKCRIIRQLESDCTYYNMSGVKVFQPVSSQILVEANHLGTHRVLFIID